MGSLADGRKPPGVVGGRLLTWGFLLSGLGGVYRLVKAFFVVEREPAVLPLGVPDRAVSGPCKIISSVGEGGQPGSFRSTGMTLSTPPQLA